MIRYHVAVQAYFSPETVERVLRVVRHRGFQLCAMTMNTATDAENITIALTVTSVRPIELLSNQLHKLIDVGHVEITPCSTALQHMCAWA